MNILLQGLIPILGEVALEEDTKFYVSHIYGNFKNKYMCKVTKKKKKELGSSRRDYGHLMGISCKLVYLV